MYIAEYTLPGYARMANIESNMTISLLFHNISFDIQAKPHLALRASRGG